MSALEGVLRVLTEIAERHQARPSSVALRWLIEQGAVPIPGAKNGQQAATNAGALRLTLEGAEIDALSAATLMWQ